MTVPRSAPGEDSGGSHQPRFRGPTDRKYGRHALQCNKESPPGDVAEMLRLRAGAEGRMVKLGAADDSPAGPRQGTVRALASCAVARSVRGAAPQQMCRSAKCPEWDQRQSACGGGGIEDSHTAACVARLQDVSCTQDSCRGCCTAEGLPGREIRRHWPSTSD